MCQEENVYRRALWNAARIIERSADRCPMDGWIEACAEIDDENVCVKCWHEYLLEQAQKGGAG